jgi:hypothetical protein
MIENSIKPYHEFSEYFNFDDKDSEILNAALNLNSGQSTFQSKYFVAKSQLTPYRMIRQCLLELETRHHSWFNIKNKLKRKRVEVQVAKREMEATNDELSKQLIACDIEDMEHDCKVWERKIIQAAEEVETYLKLAKEIADGDQELLEKAYGYDDEEERQYWITRMAKQAAMDMVSYGRIGSGNMDSIAMMDEDDQVQTLARTLQYNEKLMTGMRQIGEAVNQGLLQQTELPKYHVPGITDKLLIKELIEDVQHTTKSKIKPESI